jgi:hypothetical protein
MRHRETIRRKLEQIDSNMANMDLLVKRGGNVDSFLELISRTRDIVEETKSFIELEPTTPDEINIIR